MNIGAELTAGRSKIQGYLTNLSLGGSFFHSEELPRVDGVYKLEFTLPRGFGRCQAMAKVVWVRAHVIDTSRGVGLSFEHVSTLSRGRITNYLNSFKDIAADMDFEGTMF
jgi:hypothetical protein